MGNRIWKIFDGAPNGARSTNGLRVTLAKTRTIYINFVTFEALGRPDAVELMFDDLRNIIGMRATEPVRQNAFPVKLHTTGRLMRICASAFCTQWGIQPKGTVLFQKAAIGEGGVLELPLDNLVRVQRGSR
jgi:hypothetical protein